MDFVDIFFQCNIVLQHLHILNGFDAGFEKLPLTKSIIQTMSFGKYQTWLNLSHLLGQWSIQITVKCEIIKDDITIAKYENYRWNNNKFQDIIELEIINLKTINKNIGQISLEDGYKIILYEDERYESVLISGPCDTLNII
jgi:hypothetical protein